MNICNRCGKDSNKEYVNMQICFVCSSVVCNTCSCESIHDLEDDPLITKMYGIYHNANVDEILNEKCKTFMMLRSIFYVPLTFENEYEEWIYNIETEQDLNLEFRKFPTMLRRDHSRFQNNLQKIKMRFKYELIKLMLRKKFINDISCCIMDFL